MMRPCEECECWAQWRATYPDKSVHLLCAVHKTRLGEKIAGNPEYRFAFVGAVPLSPRPMCAD